MKIKADIYLKAAESMFLKLDVCERQTFSCRAIQIAVTGKGEGCVSSPCIETAIYQELFSPEEIKDSHWGNAWGEERDECRVLALCFAAAMAETGDL